MIKPNPTIEERKIEQGLQQAVLDATFKNLENFRWNETVRNEADMRAKGGPEEGEGNLYPGIDQPQAIDDNEREHRLRMKELDHKHEEEMMRLSADIGGFLTRKKEPIILEKPRCFSRILSLLRRKVRKGRKNQKDSQDK
ncbi:hypothetical protein DdX_20640 [Ditylenchus destructor]|uniref:Uncharacterized protein n=1 Tax=Ditylenchus destructor TaxID=166010 RepID=A0AAD4QTI0_9BILA|nr:hypothetical protein DdX_20640 [Ditylenchus destructor]